MKMVPGNAPANVPDNVTAISRDDKLLEIATRWVLKIDEGTLCAKEETELGEWLDDSTRHRVLLREVAVVWEKTEALSRLAELFPHDSKLDEIKRGAGQLRWAQRVAVAASLAMLIIGAVGFLNPVSDREAPTTSAVYETAIGTQKTVLLPDGSEVVMNTNSRLAVTYTPAARVLRLVRGEVLVRVAEDEARPLSVFAGDRIIQAVGTEFVVEITDNHQVQLMVTEGKVVIGIQPPITAPRSEGDAEAMDTIVLPPVLAPLEENLVSAGETVTLSAADPVRKVLPADEVEVKLSWRDGRLIFRSEPLEKALREIERYTMVEFVFLDESLKNRSLSGRFRAGDVDELLLLLKVNFNIVHEFDGENRVLLSSL